MATDKVATNRMGLYMLVVDAREPSEPGSYYFELLKAPTHMLRELSRMAKDGKRRHEGLYEADGAESMRGLVREHEEEEVEEQRAEAVWSYLMEMCTESNRLSLPFQGRIDYEISMVDC